MVMGFNYYSRSLEWMISNGGFYGFVVGVDYWLWFFIFCWFIINLGVLGFLFLLILIKIIIMSLWLKIIFLFCFFLI